MPRSTHARFRNPVLPGSHPDPSICRVGDDYYVVTSTFEYFPGLPVHHSKDLVHWRLVGHVLDRPSQLDLDGVRASGGLYAPTIRHHDGVFYVVCTLVDGTGASGNFVVTATDPAGKWSDPVWLPEAEGFDPSLLFDTDGSAWYCATRQLDDAGHTAVWVQQFDTDRLALTGEQTVVWQGALQGARWSEAPHIYRIGDWYYLLTAEGGTSMEHAVVVARSESVGGPYIGCERNPVLTARHLGAAAPVVATGHADLVETPDGQWWAVLLGVRDGERGLLGRETFLVPVSWEDGWPVFCPGVGHVRLAERRPILDDVRWPEAPRCESFDDTELAPDWMFVRTPRESWWSLTERPGWLRLRARAAALADTANPSFVCRRLRSRDFTAFTALEFTPVSDDETAGVALVHGPDFQLRLEISGVGQRVARVVRRAGGVDEIAGTISISRGLVRLGVEAHGPHVEFRLNDGTGWRIVARCDASHLSYRSAGGFFGVVVGMFACGNSQPEPGVADFDWFELCDRRDLTFESGADDAADYPYSTDPPRENS
jgi:alpha-N-arabinofuranosidase